MEFSGLDLVVFAVQPVLAKGASKEGSSTHDSGHHGDINSGKDFGQHVIEMNDHFSGSHNPGKHHNGYSGIKK